MGIMAKAISGKDYVPSKRYMGDLTILFWKKDEIYVKGASGIILFHRWFSNVRGFYKNSWEPFQKALKHRNGMTMTQIMILARNYEIDFMVTNRWPEGGNNGKL